MSAFAFSNIGFGMLVVSTAAMAGLDSAAFQHDRPHAQRVAGGLRQLDRRPDHRRQHGSSRLRRDIDDRRSDAEFARARRRCDDSEHQ